MMKKTHDRFQPWVFVEIVRFIDKRQRHRLLRRLPEGRLAGHCQSRRAD
jgi:hypothetical protein